MPINTESNPACTIMVISSGSSARLIEASVKNTQPFLSFAPFDQGRQQLLFEGAFVADEIVVHEKNIGPPTGIDRWRPVRQLPAGVFWCAAVRP
jgi:hypothetical protein